MSTLCRILRWWLPLLGFAATGASAQSGNGLTLHGRVVQVERGTPIRGAVIRSLHSPVRAVSDSAGAFVLALERTPDTLLVQAIGFLPESIALEATTPKSLTIALRPVAVQLQELVSHENRSSHLASGMNGVWEVKGKATTVLPTAVEPDINRSLILIPAVSFTSLLSSRPMLRGLDADDAGYTIDGFEAINLYHVGRFFSAIPALAADRAEVRLQPVGAGLGGTTAGRVDIFGRQGEGAPKGEMRYGLGAWSGSVGAGGRLPFFVAGRTARLTFVDALQSDAESQYGFWDLYLNSRPMVGTQEVELTMFTSADRAVAQEDVTGSTDEPSMHWTNLVLGARTALSKSVQSPMTISMSFARHEEESQRVPARDEKLDVGNRFAKATVAFAGARVLDSAMTLRFGAEASARSVENHLHPSDSGPGLLLDRTDARPEETLYAEVEHQTGSLGMTLGIRGTLARSASALEPHLQLRWRPRPTDWLTVGFGEATRTYHLISDARSEPKLAYYDIWLPAGENGIPVPRVRHATAEYGHAFGSGEARIGVFFSKGTGTVDLRTQESGGLTGGDSLFRVGDVRVAGADISVSVGSSDGRWSMMASYALTFSDRRWDGRWVPWVNGRTHQARLLGTARGGRGIRLSATAELTSGAPYTPILGWSASGDPARPIPTNGTENSATGVALLRGDASMAKEFHGPLGSHLEVGFSITNLSVGEQAPRRDDLVTRFAGGVYTTRVRTKLLFDLPPVPSLTFRLQFGAP